MATSSEQPASPPADVDPLAMVRSRSYVQALVLAAAIGVPVSAIAYGFLAAGRLAAEVPVQQPAPEARFHDSSGLVAGATAGTVAACSSP